MLLNVSHGPERLNQTLWNLEPGIWFQPLLVELLHAAGLEDDTSQLQSCDRSRAGIRRSQHPENQKLVVA